MGVGTSGDPFDGEDRGLEGHFPWIVFNDYSSTPVPDGCEGALAAFVAPEPN